MSAIIHHCGYVRYHTPLWVCPLSHTTMGRVQPILFLSHSSEVHEEFHPPPIPIDYTSTTMKDFGKGSDNNENIYSKLSMFNGRLLHRQ